MARDYSLKMTLPASGTQLVDAQGFITNDWRRAMEQIATALFGERGEEDVTLGLTEGSIELGTGTSGDYVASVSNGTGVTVVGGSGEGSTPTISIAQEIGATASPTFNGLTVTTNITVSGTVDGRDVAADGTKLDGIESSATADQTGAEIKTAYEGEADTNAFTDAEQTKLSGIATGATANDTDANLLNRANHTGAQAISTVTNLQTELDDKVSRTTSITDASASHSLNIVFSDTEVEAALDALGAKINEIIDALDA